MQMKVPKIQDISGDSNTKTAVQLRTEWIGYLQCNKVFRKLNSNNSSQFFVNCCRFATTIHLKHYLVKNRVNKMVRLKCLIEETIFKNLLFSQENTD